MTTTKNQPLLLEKIEKLKLDYAKLTFIEKQIGGKILLTTNFKYPPKILTNEISSIIEDSLTNIKFIKDMNYQVGGETINLFDQLEIF